MTQVSERKMARKPRVRRSRGQFTKRLVSEEGMADALRYLLSDVQQYMLIVNRAAINSDSGESQDASIAFSESDPPLLEDSLDARLKHSRRIIAILMLNDGGVAKIDLTRRSWEIWITSPSVRERLRTFKRKLRAVAHSWLITIDSGVLIAGFPIWSIALLFFAWSFSSKKTRYEVWSTKNGGKKSSWPLWLQHYESIIYKLWPIFILIGAAICVIVLLSGGLKIWPRYLSRISFQRASYEVRSNLAIPQNLNAPLFVGLAGAIVGAVITVLLSRYLG